MSPSAISSDRVESGKSLGNTSLFGGGLARVGKDVVGKQAEWCQSSPESHLDGFDLQRLETQAEKRPLIYPWQRRGGSSLRTGRARGS